MVVINRMARSISMRNLVKTGFGLSVGVFFAQMIFILIGLVFFIPGYMLFKKADKEKSEGSKVGGIVLMGLGVVIMGGVGIGLLMDSVGDMDF
jgi:predicted transporter